MPIYSLSAAGGAATEAGGGASGTGAAGARAAFGAGGFFAAAAAGGAAACAEAAAGARGAGAAFVAGAACLVVAVGSGFMMLTGGVDEALGNSALVGLPVGIAGGSPASAAVDGIAGAAAGAVQVGAWRATSMS